MTTDNTALSLSVDSTQVRTAEQDLRRFALAGEKVEQSTKQMESALKSQGRAAEDLGRSIGAAVLGIGALTVGAVVGLDRLIKSVGDYQDLADKTQADPAGLASIRTAADVAGVSLRQVGDSMVRLTSNLSKVDDESKTVGKGLAAIGLEVEKFKALRPDEQYKAIATQLDKYADGAGKVAVVTALLGKGGAEQLKVFKELAQQQEQNNFLTNEQIALGDEYADRSARASSQIKQLAQAAAIEAAPAILALKSALSDSIKEMLGIDSATGKLAANSGIKDFAKGAVEALAFVVDAGRAVARVFDLVGNSIGAVLAADAAASKGEFRQAISILEDFGRKAKSIREEALGPSFSDRVRANLAAGLPNTPGPQKPALDASGLVIPTRGGGGSKADPFDSEVKKLKEQIALVGQLTELEKVSARIKLDAFGRISAAQRAQLFGLAAELDLRKDIDAERKAGTQINISAIERELDKLAGVYAAAESVLEAQRSAGLVSEGEYYDAKAAFLRLNAEAQSTALRSELAVLQQEKVSGDARVRNLEKQKDIQKQLSEIEVKAAATSVVLAIQQKSAQDALARSFVESEKAAASYLRTFQLKQDRAVAAVGQGDREREFSSGLNEIEDRFSGRREQLERERRTGLYRDNQAAYERELRLLEQSKNAEVEVYKSGFSRITEARQDFNNGAERALQNYITDAQNIARQTEDAFTHAFKGMEDALVTFVTTGRLNFKSLADGIVADITRIIIKQQLIKPLESLLGGGGSSFLGSLFGSSSSAQPIGNLGADFVVPGFASGGRPRPGRVSMVGENGPELFIPDQPGRILSAADTKAAIAPTGDTRPVVVTVNQQFASGTTRATMDQAAAAAGRTVRAALARGTA